jgi:hypothetical protein
MISFTLDMPQFAHPTCRPGSDRKTEPNRLGLLFHCNWRLVRGEADWTAARGILSQSRRQVRQSFDIPRDLIAPVIQDFSGCRREDVLSSPTHSLPSWRPGASNPTVLWPLLLFLVSPTSCPCCVGLWTRNHRGGHGCRRLRSALEILPPAVRNISVVACMLAHLRPPLSGGTLSATIFQSFEFTDGPAKHVAGPMPIGETIVSSKSRQTTAGSLSRGSIGPRISNSTPPRVRAERKNKMSESGLRPPAQTPMPTRTVSLPESNCARETAPQKDGRALGAVQVGMRTRNKAASYYCL